MQGLARRFWVQRVGGLARRASAKWDYLSFVMRRVWPLVVGVAGVLAGTVALMPSRWGLAVSATLVLVSFVMFVRDVVLARGQWSRFRCDRVISPFPVADVPSPLAYEGAVYLSPPDRGTMQLHPDADRTLQEDLVQVELDPTPYQLPAELRDFAPSALRTMRKGRVVFDGQMLGLRDDLLPAVSGESRPLRLMRTSYFNHICSADLCQYRITDRITGAQSDIRRMELIDPSGRLVTLAGS